MSESGPKMSAKDILSQTLIGETNVTVEQSQDINLIGLPADYTAQILTLTSADLVKQGANSMALDRGSIKTRHMLLIDCQCE